MVDPALELAATRMYLMAEDVLAIQSIIPRTGTPLVIDLGSGSGTTALAILGANPDAVVFSYDIDQGASDWAVKNVELNYPDANVTWAVGDAAAAGEDFGYYPGEVREIDVLLHDASHERALVLADLRAWLKYCKVGTPVWVHDAAPPPQSWGQIDQSDDVIGAIMELKEEGLLTDGRIQGLGWIGARA